MRFRGNRFFAVLLLLITAPAVRTFACSNGQCKLPAGFSHEEFSQLVRGDQIGLVLIADNEAESGKMLAVLDRLKQDLPESETSIKILAIFPGRTEAETEALREELWLDFELQPDPERKLEKAFSWAFGGLPLPWTAMIDADGLLGQSSGSLNVEELRAGLEVHAGRALARALCPVCLMWVQASEKTPSLLYQGTRYYFCSPEDHGGVREDLTFLEDPERYIDQAQTYLETAQLPN
jgi:YHS domain-containing protein